MSRSKRNMQMRSKDLLANIKSRASHLCFLQNFFSFESWCLEPWKKMQFNNSFLRRIYWKSLLTSNQHLNPFHWSNQPHSKLSRKVQASFIHGWIWLQQNCLTGLRFSLKAPHTHYTAFFNDMRWELWAPLWLYVRFVEPFSVAPC